MPREAPEPSDQNRLNVGLTRAHSSHENDPDDEARQIDNVLYATLWLTEMRENAREYRARVMAVLREPALSSAG